MSREIAAQIAIRLLISIPIAAFFAAFGFMEYTRINSTAYKESLEVIRANEQARSYLGDYIKRDWLITGSPIAKRGGKQVEFEYSVVGVKNRGRVKVIAFMKDKAIIEKMSVSLSVKNHETLFMDHDGR